MSNEESKSDLVKEARELLARARQNGLSEADTTEIALDYIKRSPSIISALCDEVEELKGRNSMQEESITHFQSQQRVMKEAIEAARAWIDKFKTLDHNAFHAANQGFEWEKCNERTCQKAVALVDQLRSAITPKGSNQ